MASQGDASDSAPEPAETIDAPVENVPARRRGFSAPRLRRRRVALITDAQRTPEQNLRHRERLYGVVQGVRLPLLGLAMLTLVAWDNWIIAGALFCVSIPLPWIAVVLANGRGEPRDPRSPKVYKPALAREQAIAQLQAAERTPELPPHERPTPKDE
ncbi:DUF3099 domain-containing protein [Corynebacterium lowii]|nr:DUF3099 domain-containing protein [Corynebacterium lowii]MDP9851213.1 hypothetical protein [Corynebacterium lowii]